MVDQLMPFYVMETMGSVPGLTGLFVAGIFSSALSSVSPVLNSLAAVTMEDYIKVHMLFINNLPALLIILLHINDKIIIHCFITYLAFCKTRDF